MFVCFVSSLCGWHRRQVLEDEEPEYGGMIADTIYIFQGALSLEVSQSPECAHSILCACFLVVLIPFECACFSVHANWIGGRVVGRLVLSMRHGRKTCARSRFHLALSTRDLARLSWPICCV